MIACYFGIHSRTSEIWREGFFCWKFWYFIFIVGLWARGKQPRLDFGTLDLPFLDHSIAELGIYYEQKYDNTDNNIPHKKALYHISQNNKRAATHTHNIKSLNILLSNQLSTRFIRMWIQKEIWMSVTVHAQKKKETLLPFTFIIKTQLPHPQITLKKGDHIVSASMALQILTIKNLER